MDARARQALLLVVDDDVRTARLLVRMLRDDGFQVELAVDGASAIARLGRSPVPDALVTDIRMPYADGMSVARYARSRRPEMAVFVVTGYPHLVCRGSSGDLSPPALVHTKPLDYQRLIDQLRALEVAPSVVPASVRSQ